MLRLPKSHISALQRTLTTMATRAIVYESNGNPASVLSAVTCPRPPKPTGSSIAIKNLLSPVNPSDINAVEGVYPHQPRARQVIVNGQERTLHIPGNEGLGEVKDVGEDVKNLKKGDWVVFRKSQSGTWSSGQVLDEGDVIKVDRESGISAVNAATLVVRCTHARNSNFGHQPRTTKANPITAYNMLSDFVDLQPGDWVVQNGANSAVRWFKVTRGPQAQSI